MIIHKKCDIFESGADIICHQVNCQGVMGSGVAKQVKEKYPPVYRAYVEWCENYEATDLLGKSQFVPLKPMWTANESNGELMGIVNIFGQLNYGYNGKCYTDYDALKHAFDSIHQFLNLFESKPIIAFPYKFGCARGGGDWDKVFAMISEEFKDITVLICECDKG